jgi:hypothetical protein
MGKKFIMKKNILLLISSVFICISCDDNNSVEKSINSTNQKDDILNIAKQYGYKLESTNTRSDIFKVTNTNELENTLESIKNDFETPKFRNSENIPDSIDIEKAYSLIESTYKLISKDRNSIKMLITKKITNDPPYKYSQTVNFDNTFPASNVYIRIDYNTDAKGNITDAMISSGTYGYSFGNTYNQLGVNMSYSGMSLVFEITGQTTTSVGMSDFSLTNTNTTVYSGYMQIRGGGLNSISKGYTFVKQQAIR